MWKRFMLYLEQRRCDADWDKAISIDPARLSRADRDFKELVLDNAVDAYIKSAGAAFVKSATYKDPELSYMELVAW